MLAIIVENESDVAAFKDYQATDVETTPTTTTPTPVCTLFFIKIKKVPPFSLHLLNRQCHYKVLFILLTKH